jgi:20S proteasome alpha/beta subunit
VASPQGIIQVDPSGGLHPRKDFACGGSGGSYLRSHLTANYKENMTAAEAMELMERAMSLSIKFDKSSGGCIRMFNICEDKTLEKKFLDFYSFNNKV